MRFRNLGLVLFLGGGKAFAPRRSFSSRPASAAKTSTTTQRHATAKLVFRGDYVTTTDPLPAGTTQEDVAHFLSTPENRNVFLSAGGTRAVEPVDMTPQFKRYWQDICQHFHSSVSPADDDQLVQVATEVKFPGLKLVTTTLSGIKEIRNDKQILQAYEVFLIAEKMEPKGAVPMVWIYNKLTGNDKNEKGVFQPPKQAKAKSVIGYTELDDGSLALSFQLDMQITIEFPAVLLKILPTSKAKAEEQGSAAVMKTVSKDIDLAMMTAYDKFMEQKQVQQ